MTLTFALALSLAATGPSPDALLKEWQAKRTANASFPELEALTKKIDVAILEFKGVPTQKTVELQAARAQIFQSAMAIVGKRVDTEPFKSYVASHDRWLIACASGYWTINQRGGWPVVDDLRQNKLDAEPLAWEVANTRCRARHTARYDMDLLFDFGAAREYLKRFARGPHAGDACGVFAVGESDRTALAKAMLRDEDSSFEDAADAVDGWLETVNATTDSEAKTRAVTSLRELRKKLESRAKEVGAE